MKNDVTDKSIMRRYLDDLYTQEEARGLLSRLKDDIHAPMLDELATDVWKEATMEELTTGMEREKYKEEAGRLLKRIEHKKRTWFRRIAPDGGKCFCCCTAHFRGNQSTGLYG